MARPRIVPTGQMNGRRGLPGVNAVPAKEAVDAYNGELVADPTSATGVGVAAKVAETTNPIQAAVAALQASVAAFAGAGVFRGAWSAGSYVAGDMVTSGGVLYGATGAAVAGDVPGSAAVWVALPTTVDSTARTDVAARVKYSEVPVLATNRVLDPQVKTSGGVTSGTIYTLARITTGLPAGASYGIQATRTGTLSSVAAQLYAGSLTNTDPLRIPVTVAEQISVACQVWCGTASHQARIDVRWYSSAGTLLSTTTGTYTALAASTWEQRVVTGLTVPASAAYCVPIATVAAVSGNTSSGVVSKATQFAIVTGTTAPTYGDGTVTGWFWTGTAHASTSSQIFQSAATQQTLAGLPARVSALESATAGAIGISRTGDTVALTTLLGTDTLVRSFSLTGSTGGGFNILGATRNGTTVHNVADDITPLRISIGAVRTVGGNHEYDNVAAFTNPDGKTTADLGSRWTDGTREYVLLGIVSGKLVMGGAYTLDGSGVVQAPTPAPTANLTHVSGATHTGAIVYTTLTTTTLPGTTVRRSTVATADGKAIPAGASSAREVVVREVYDVIDYADLYDKAKANVGVSYTTLNIKGTIRVANTFRYRSPGLCRVTTELLELTPVGLSENGAIQAGALGDGVGTVKRYLPGVGTIGGNNWTTGVDLAAYLTAGVSQQVATGNLLSATFPPPFSLDVLSASGTPTIGFALGYLPYGVRGDEATINSRRITKAGTELWDLRNTTKQYAVFTMNEAAGWGRLVAESYRIYLTGTDSAAITSALGGVATDAPAAWTALNTLANVA